MKKFISLFCVVLFTLVYTGSAVAVDMESAVFKLGEKKYILDSRELPMDIAPFESNNRAYIPIDYLAHCLGIDDEEINIETIPMDVPPLTKDSSMCLPVRWVAESLGYTVKWDQSTGSVTLSAPGKDKRAPAIPAPFNIDTRETNPESDSLELDLKIPVISGFKDVMLQQELNERILNQVMQEKAELEESYPEYAENAKTNGFPVMPYQLFVSYETAGAGSVVSLVVQTYHYSGGAHGGAWKDFYNLDIENGKILTLRELFKEEVDYKFIINQEINRQIDLARQTGDSMFFEGDMGFKTISDNHPFYINEEHLVFCFGQYEIAPYAAGMPEFQVPLSLLKEHLREEFLSLIQD